MEKKYFQSAQEEVKQWEQSGPGWLSHVSEFMLWPATKAAKMLVPPGMQEKAGQAIAKLLTGTFGIVAKTVPFAKINEAVKKRTAQMDNHEISARLAAADAEAQSRWNWHLGYAATEGAATGSVGLLGLAADIPALFALILRMIQEIGACYGFEMKSAEERDYVLHILETGAAGDVKTKLEALLVLKELEEVLVAVAWKKLAARQASKFSVLGGVKSLAKSLGITLTERKALQMIPLIGGIVGASFNLTFANDIGRAAYMCYRRRWIAARLVPDTRSAAGAAAEASEAPRFRQIREVSAGTLRARNTKVSSRAAIQQPRHH